MILDNITVIFNSILLSGLVSLMSWALALTKGKHPWRTLWAVGNTSLLLGITLFLGQGTLNPWITVVIANILVISGYLFFESAIRSFLYKTFDFIFIGLILGSTLVVFTLFGIFFENMRIRVLVHGVFTMSILGRMAWLLHTGFSEERKRHPFLVNGFIVAIVLAAMVYFGRTALTFTETTTTLLDPSASLAALFLFIQLALIAWTIGFIALDLLRNQRALEKSIAARDRMFSVIAHDLRGPVGSLAGMLELMKQEDGCSDEQQDNIALTAQTARGSYTLLENLLHWARSQKGDITYTIKTINLPHLISLATNPLLTQASTKDLMIQSTMDPSLTILGDEPTLATVIRNILSNAIKFSPRGSPIQIHAEPKGPWIQIEISDLGPGIPLEVANSIKVGEPPQSNHGSEGEQGTGLGLMVSYDFVIKNRGQIKFERTNPGTKVILLLPTNPT